VEPNHAVYSLLRRRIMTFIFQSLGHSSSQPLQLPGGIGAVSDDIASYCGKVWSDEVARYSYACGWKYTVTI